MSEAPAAVNLHEAGNRFLEALRWTERITQFNARLLEKDYYCSLVLADFHASFEVGLIFKGGTCLSKV